VILTLFGLVTFAALDRAFRASALQAQEERMQGLVYLLLGLVDVLPDQSLTFNELSVADQRFFAQESGLMAAIAFEEGGLLWKSASWNEAVGGPIRQVETGKWFFEPFDASPGRIFRLSFGVTWVLDGGKSRKFTIFLGEDPSVYRKQLRIYHGTLAHWLAVAAFLLLISLVMVLRWGLRPLHRVADEIRDVQEGKRDQLCGPYPRELKPLTEGLNSLLRHEQGQRKRYRNALDDLAHSLKTPLAALRGFAQAVTEPPEARGQLNDQVDRIGKALDYQVRRASTAGRSAFTQPLDLQRTAEKVISALSKVYREKGIEYDLHVDPPDLTVPMDESDLMEILGNLADNASKWSAKRVRLEARTAEDSLRMRVEDDGPGFPEEGRERLLERGVRADRRMPGEGIGLSVVSEIVALYGGSMNLARSDLGGGRVDIKIPI
jgi:two-component system sensor histidine kinase PhoQ